MGLNAEGLDECHSVSCLNYFHSYNMDFQLALFSFCSNDFGKFGR